MLVFIILLEILIIFVLFVNLGYKAFKSWKTMKEEALLHISIFYFMIAFIFMSFPFLVYFSNFELSSPTYEIVFLSDTIYNLFYLEISIFYLSIFTNSRSQFESYAPFFMGISTILTLIVGVSATEIYTQLSSFFHFISISIAVSLIILGIRHIKNSKKYVHTEKEINFLNYILKILKIAPILLISDMISFSYIMYNPDLLLLIDEVLLLIIFTFILLFSIVIYYLSMDFGKRAKNIDIIALLNSIS